MAKLKILVYQNEEVAFETICSSGIEIGRQDTLGQGGQLEPSPFTVHKHPVYGPRLVIVPQARTDVPRRTFSLSIDDEKIRIKNVHARHDLEMSSGATIEPGKSICVAYDAMIELTADLSIRVELNYSESELDSQGYRTLNTSPPTPDSYPSNAVSQTLMQLVGSAGSGAGIGPVPFPTGMGAETEDDLPDDLSEMLVGDKDHDAVPSRPRRLPIDTPANPILDLLRKALEVVREASGSDAFLAAAVRAAGEIVGLDQTTLLMRQGADEWKVRAKYEKPLGSRVDRNVSRTILDLVAESGKTKIYDATSWKGPQNSLQNVRFALGSPVLDGSGQVIAVLYGDRRGSEVEKDKRITKIEATFVEILAGAVAAGLAIRDEEDRRSALAGFFSPRVADLLSSRPELLEPKEAEVSVLFCDIRGFSGVTENSSPQLTFQWLQDVLSEVSQCVVDLDGVLVDYVGDQLFATWGAPDAQSDHQARALKACVAIQKVSVVLRERWASRISNPFALGIGVSTGIAQAGNVGSRQKFKYGVLGNTVNLGSRLQDATKQLGVDCIAEAVSVRGAGWAARARRLTKLQVSGIEGVVEAFEIVPEESAEWLQLKSAYELALGEFENGRFAEATSSLGILLQDFPNDKPTQLLLERAVNELRQPTLPFTGVHKLLRK